MTRPKRSHKKRRAVDPITALAAIPDEWSPASVLHAIQCRTKRVFRKRKVVTG